MDLTKAEELSLWKSHHTRGGRAYPRPVRQMMELRDTYGTSIIVVPHNLGVAAYMSDNIVVMRHGKIEDQGGRAHILSHSENAYTRTLLDAVPSLGGMRYV